MQSVAIRSVFGFIVAPVIPGSIVAILIVAADLLSTEKSWDTLLSAKLLFVIGIMFGYLTAFLFGIPTYFFLKKTNHYSFLAYAVSGAILGFISLCLYFAIDCIAYCAATYAKIINHAHLFIPSIISGCIAAISFWFIARPDLATKK